MFTNLPRCSQCRKHPNVDTLYRSSVAFYECLITDIALLHTTTAKKILCIAPCSVCVCVWKSSELSLLFFLSTSDFFIIILVISIVNIFIIIYYQYCCYCNYCQYLWYCNICYILIINCKQYLNDSIISS